jgi:hypothetical protein
LDFVLSHAEFVRGEAVFKVFHTVLIKLAFSGIGIEAMLAESVEHFLNMVLVLRHVVGVDQDIIEIDYIGKLHCTK